MSRIIVLFLLLLTSIILYLSPAFAADEAKSYLLTLSSRPEVGLEIYIDGVTTGLRTPRTLSLPAGKHNVRLIVPRFKTETVWETEFADGTMGDHLLRQFGQTKVREDVEKGSTIVYNATDVVLFGKYSMKVTNTPGLPLRGHPYLGWHWFSSEPGKPWIKNDLEIKESLINVWTYVSGKPGPEKNWFSLITVVYDAGWDSGRQTTTTDVLTEDMKIHEWFNLDSGKFNRKPLPDAPVYPLDKWVKISLYTKLNGAQSRVMVFQDDYLVGDYQNIDFDPANTRPDYMHWGGYGSAGNGQLTTWNSRTSVERVIGPGPAFALDHLERDGKKSDGDISGMDIELTADTHLCAFGKAPETFGAEGNPTGDAIGGGIDYRRAVTHGNFTVTSFEELRDALGKAKAGETVFVSDGVKIDLTGREGLVIPAGVTLAGGRGVGNTPGALLFTRQLQTFKEPVYANVVLLRTGGDNVRITGLRLRGPDPELRTVEMIQLSNAGTYYTVQNSDGIECTHAGLEVDNCELWGWSHAAVYLKSTGQTTARIHHNNIHHNQREGLGYGVSLNNNAQAVIEANIFDWNRHAIADSGMPGSGYEASYNIIGFNANGHSFDMHGGKDRKDGTDIAGDWLRIHHNTFYATDVSAICIRGIPNKSADINHNWFLNADPKTAIVQSNAVGGMKVKLNLFGLEKTLIE